MNDNTDPDNIDNIMDAYNKGDLSANGARQKLGMPPIPELNASPKRSTEIASRIVIWALTIGIVGCVVIGLIALAKLVLG